MVLLSSYAMLILLKKR